MLGAYAAKQAVTNAGDSITTGGQNVCIGNGPNPSAASSQEQIVIGTTTTPGAGDNTVRFVVNTTLGILGLIDVAEYLGLPEYEKEDYGQTLAAHGVGPGCYVVLPILGSSTARDAVASLANFMGGDAWYNVSVKNDTQYFSDIDYYASKGMAGVDFRAKNYDSIENLEKNSLDFYASVKSLYLQDRQQKILNSRKIINTQDDSDWEEISQ